MTRLRAIRGQRSQTEVAKLIFERTGRRIHISTLSRWERGLQPASWSGQAQALLEALDLEYEQAFGTEFADDRMPAELARRNGAAMAAFIPEPALGRLASGPRRLTGQRPAR